MKQIELIGPPLYQWDTGRCVRVSVRGATEAHFAIAGSARALVTPVVGGEAPVPSLLLTAGADIAAWASDGRDTQARAVLRVRPRAKPDGYIYTDDEVKTWADIEDWVREQLKSAGEPGTKWYVGGGAPATGGRVGDLYLDSETGTYYRYGEIGDTNG
ncbi:hypothetical protein PMW71_04950 [Collinsella aerofaciens]|uniref:Uncharacterized protein n=1 Tax=Collinsella aerofaciens TaxID=74426 RepID=A0AAW6AJC1_9ACTN|nr:hypothetical protein [Collinsella aerofaciens]MDB1835169.1 hypothetical protein [Collinsella aerofaciens]MDB1836797.1 hypothetical protein [Collinsella aerofaciens]MDB1838223.1 hypothetical protein [Collinsella aerofaciens]MDB1840786.1 hypothetical protein [Collinsella aerofaciens]MDB1842692.1 hypothetical protein [Collinsella aerofaciens]